MSKLFYVEKFESYNVYKFLFFKLKLRHKYSCAELFHSFNKILFCLIPNYPAFLKKSKYFCFSFFDDYYKNEWNIRYKKYSYDEIIKLFKVYENFPKNIMTVNETVDYILNNNCSISRIGDTEELLFNMLGEKCKFENLKEKLINIYKNGSDNKCLVCINNFHATTDDVPILYRKHFINYWLKVYSKGFLNLDYNHNENYGDAYAFFFLFKEDDTQEVIEAKKQKIKQIWEKKKILFVVNKSSKILSDNIMFDNAKQKDFLFVPPSDAFSEYEKTKLAITEKYDNSWLIYLECGALATVLAYELSKLGYQALDMGNFYKRVCIVDKINFS